MRCPTSSGASAWPQGWNGRRCIVSATGWRRISEGKVLKAQARLGHRDPSTTLRHYSHAVPLDDEDIADELDALLNRQG